MMQIYKIKPYQNVKEMLKFLWLQQITYRRDGVYSLNPSGLT